MAKHVFTTDLSVRGIKKLISNLEDYKKSLDDKVEMFAQRLAERGVEVAKANVSKLGAVFTGDLINSIHSQSGGTDNGSSVFYVVAGTEHCAFVEFGTGQMGEEAPYPYPLPEGISWNYNSGSTIFEISPGQYGWFYNRDGQWYFTQGMPSRPFMYETSMELMQEVEKIAKEVFA